MSSVDDDQHSADTAASDVEQPGDGDGAESDEEAPELTREPSIEDDPFVDQMLSACKNGRLDVVRSSVNVKMVSVNSKNRLGETALMVAARAGKRPIVEWLLKNGVRLDLDAEDHVSLCCALSPPCSSDSKHGNRFLCLCVATPENLLKCRPACLLTPLAVSAVGATVRRAAWLP
jgi:hypothetical protein